MDLKPPDPEIKMPPDRHLRPRVLAGGRRVPALRAHQPPAAKRDLDPAGARKCLEEARAALASAPDAAGVREMVAVAGRQLDSTGRARAAEQGLSDRELGVLRLLATDLTQREIGRELYLSLNTVKSHTRSIFRKLGVSGRERAVTRARELGLI